jgi:Mn2+/Fe2+ NRAMP family transporter
VLLVPMRTNLLGEYRHPIWLAVAGWAVVAIMTAFSLVTVYGYLR